MTKLLEKAIKLVYSWPKKQQDEAAELLLNMGGEGELYALSDEERADIRQGLKEIEAGEIASDKEVRAVHKKYGL